MSRTEPGDENDESREAGRDDARGIVTPVRAAPPTEPGAADLTPRDANGCQKEYYRRTTKNKEHAAFPHMTAKQTRNNKGPIWKQSGHLIV